MIPATKLKTQDLGPACYGDTLLARPRTSDALSDNRKQVDRLLQAYAQKAGLPVDELERLKAARRAEQRRLLDQAADDEIEYAKRTEAERR
ncbi:MAG TPA: hypothetical protein VEH31_38715, partial [Streptosporangiaceae bacterium]|nr:hypothetical protein [Streptosporangiaceae bacterium]